MAGKLVRDLIPEIMRADGAEPQGLRIMDEAEHRAALIAKIGEERDELALAAPDERLGELADLLELVRAAAQLDGYTLTDVIEAADNKAAARGGFDGRIWVEFS